jgi:preprotein translocase subunit SecD
MKIRLHFGIAVILLAFLATFLEKTAVPNQQIIIQFSDANISSQEAESTITIVKEQLKRIGVTNIQIGQNEDGKLRITYYSDAEVERIQNILSNEDRFKLAYQSRSNPSDDFPENRNLTIYELNISEFHNHSDIDSDFEGIQIVERSQKRDGLDELKVNPTVAHLKVEHRNNLVKVVIQVNHTVHQKIDNMTYKIPEARAGPSYWEFII